MHPQNTENILAGPDIKPRTVGKSQAKGNWIRNSAEEEWGGWATHTSPTTRWHRKAALEWNPQGTRPQTTWRITILEEIRHQGKTWKEVKVLARNRVRWRNFSRVLCCLEEWWENIYIWVYLYALLPHLTLPSHSSCPAGVLVLPDFHMLVKKSICDTDCRFVPLDFNMFAISVTIFSLLQAM
jgi:hypothetical protein